MTLYPKFLTRRIYRRIMGAMTGMNDIDVVLDDGFAVPNFNPDKRRITLPSVFTFARNDDEEFKAGKGTMIHETSHVMFCPDDIWNKLFDKPRTKWEKEVNQKSKGSDKLKDDLAQWFNVFLDCNNEWKVAELFPHLKESLKFKTDLLMETNPETLHSDNPFLQTIMRCDKVAPLKPEYPSNYPYKEFVDWVVKEFNKRKIHEVKGDDIIEFSKEVNKRWGKTQETLNKEGKDGMKGIHKLMKELAEAIQSGNTVLEKALKEKIAKKSSATNFKITDENPKRISKFIPSSGHPDYNNKSLDELKKMLKKDQENIGGKKIRAPDWGNQNIEGAVKVEQIKDIEKFNENKIRSPEPYDHNAAYRAGKKIRRLLINRINLQKTFESNHRSGNIGTDNIRDQISKYGRIIRENVFNRDAKFNRGGEWAIEVLIDCSGSMGGAKMTMAKQALATLAYSLEGIPNVKYALTGFTTSIRRRQGPVELMIKTFNEKFKRKNIDALKSSAGNCDGYNIRSSGNRLLKYHNLHKVLVVISDGQPAYHYNGDDGITDSAKVVKSLTKLNIGIIGIGIEGATKSSLQAIYPTNYLFKNTTKTLHIDIVNLILSCLGQKKKAKLVKNPWHELKRK